MRRIPKTGTSSGVVKGGKHTNDEKADCQSGFHRAILGGWGVLGWAIPRHSNRSGSYCTVVRLSTIFCSSARTVPIPRPSSNWRPFSAVAIAMSTLPLAINFLALSRRTRLQSKFELYFISFIWTAPLRLWVVLRVADDQRKPPEWEILEFKR